MGLKRKRGKRVTRNGRIDGISSLPDALISHIIDLLPIKYAVRTSILSRRWRYIWTSITNIDVDDRLFMDPETNEVPHTFFDAVYGVLEHCNRDQIQKFRLRFQSEEDEDNIHISEWVSEVIIRNVRELDLDVYSAELPSSLFTCKTLTMLNLVVCKLSVLCLPPSFCLPRLKFLRITNAFCSREILDKLFCSCPVLDHLVIQGVACCEGLTFNVSAPALTRLDIELCSFDRIIGEDLEVKIVIDAPNLTCLNLEEDALSNYTIRNLSSQVHACVSIGNCYQQGSLIRAYAHRAYELLRQINAVSSLSLYSRTMGALDFAYKNNLPTFQYLTYLEVVIHDSCDWKVLLGFLESARNLELLILKKEVHDDQVATEDDFDWIEPQSVPNCLSSHLQVLEITGFEGNESELVLVKYLLGSGEVLKNVTIISPNLNQEKEVRFCKKLLEFPTVSRTCQIQFHGDLFSKF